MKFNKAKFNAKQAAKNAKRGYKLEKMKQKTSRKLALTQAAGKTARVGMVASALDNRESNGNYSQAAIQYYNQQIANVGDRGEDVGTGIGSTGTDTRAGFREN